MINPEHLIGTVLENRYRLTRAIGKGSYGWVFEAAEEMGGRFVARVAVKLLAPEDEDQREVVLREIRALAGFTHDYILAYRTSGQIVEGTLGGTIFLVTELGEVALGKALQSPQRLPDQELWTMGHGIGLALAHIHAKGAVHRDVKPGNILRVEGRWKLADFGLVRAVETTQKSGTGTKGTLRYMAPEALEGEIGPATDVYALGVTLLYCLTGRFAHEGETDAQFMANLMTKPAFIPSSVSESWKPVLTECLHREPSQRWSAAELAQHLGSPATTPRQAAGKSVPSSGRPAVEDSSTPASGLPPQEELRRAVRAALAQGVISDRKRWELLELAGRLGIAHDLAGQILREEKLQRETGTPLKFSAPPAGKPAAIPARAAPHVRVVSPQRVVSEQEDEADPTLLEVPEPSPPARWAWRPRHIAFAVLALVLGYAAFNAVRTGMLGRYGGPGTDPGGSATSGSMSYTPPFETESPVAEPSASPAEETRTVVDGGAAPTPSAPPEVVHDKPIGSSDAKPPSQGRPGAGATPEPARAPAVGAIMVSINSSPSGAEVVVDKVHVARTPFSVSLDPGPHALQFRKEGYQPRAEIIQVSKQGEKDIRFALQPLKLSPELAAQHSSQGMALYRRGDWNGAVAEFQEAIRLYPYDAMTHSNLALALQKRGDRDGAIAQYREAIRLKPPSKQNLLMIRNNLAVALYLKGDWEGAVNEFHEIIQLKPEDATAHRNLARALLKQGDQDSAIAHLREALQIQPTYSDAQQELNSLLAARAANQ